MPIRDVAAMNASLDNDYGENRGPNAADSHDMALFVGDPMTDGVELDALDNPGYDRPTILPADWLDADAGTKSTNGGVQFDNATAAWLDEATHWGLFDGSVMWDCAPLAEPLVVSAAGTGPQVTPTVFYDDSVNGAP
jgi:hypothetical protein